MRKMHKFEENYVRKNVLKNFIDNFIGCLFQLAMFLRMFAEWNSCSEIRLTTQPNVLGADAGHLSGQDARRHLL